MSNSTYFKTGIFVIVGTILGFSAIFILGVGELFQKKIRIETYFEESVQGLDVGSKIKFRGVQVGKVDEINLVANAYKTDCSLIMVRSSLYRNLVPMPIDEFLEGGIITEINKGLRVRLAYQGITGTAYLEVDYLDNKRNPVIQTQWLPKYTYIPSAPSTISRLGDSVNGIMRSLEKINLVNISGGVEETFNQLSQLLNQLKDARVGHKASQLIDELRDSNKKLVAFIKKLNIYKLLDDTKATIASSRKIVERFETLSRDLPEASGQLKRALRRFDELLFNQHQDIEVTLDNVRIISENLKELTDNAKKYPSQFIFGEPPGRSSIEK